MIKILQLVMHLPMLKIRFPANVIYFLRYYKSIQTFQAFPIKKLYQFLQMKTDTDLGNMGIDNLELGGYEFSSFFQNLGIYFIFLVFFSMLVVLMVILRLF